jgi:hypothetical protein
MVPVLVHLWYFEVAWSLKNIFILMANGRLNATHPVLLFDVLHSKKPRGLNVKQRSTFINL